MTQIIKSIDEINKCENNTVIFDDKNLKMNNSSIIFVGRNNLLFIEAGVVLENCSLTFGANNSVIYLSKSKHIYRADITVNNNCVCYIGQECYFNDSISIICSEQKHVFIGNDCLISFGIVVRTADPHLVYSLDNYKRINKSKSVLIGDHVWLGQNCIILKGSRIHSGSILGAGAVLSGKRIYSNKCFAGNPAVEVSDNIFWDRNVVHRWVSKDTELNEYFNAGDEFRFELIDESYIPFSMLDKELSQKNVTEKLDYLKAISCNDDKNRFAYKRDLTLKNRIRLDIKNKIKSILK